MKGPLLREGFRVRSYDARPDASLRIDRLCDYLQEAAGRHAQAMGLSMERLMREGYAWVLERLHLEIDGLPRAGEEVVVETWPAGAERLFAHRDFLLLRDGQVLARARSRWLVISLERRRAVRLPDFVRGHPVAERPRAIGGPYARLAEPTWTSREQLRTVRPSDLDPVGHVNNVAYVRWILDALAAGAEPAVPAALDVAFRAEARGGDTVCVRVQEGTPANHAVAHHAVAHHAIHRPSDGRTLLLAATRHRPS